MDKLAIDGEKPVRKEPFPPRIIFDEREKESVLRVVEKTMKGPEAIDLLGHGPELEDYKKEFASYYGVKYATATSSGAAAIHSALGALRLEPGSEVITSPITDPGTVAPILTQNCIPVFADVDYRTLNLSLQSIKERITERTKAIIPVHLAGQPCDMDSIMKLAKRHNLIVIEDCAQAHGAKYKGRYVGSIGHMGTFSLMGGKHTTSGGQGGMVITNDETLYWNAKRFADRGKPFNSEEKHNIFLGLNYRMTELEAAIGRVQLGKLESIVSKRRWLVDKLKIYISNLKAIRLWKVIDGVEPSYWFCFLHLDKSKLKTSVEGFVKAVNAEGIPMGAHYTQVLYQQPWIRDRQTYGRSGCPWSCPFYNQKIDYTNCCPQAEEALKDHLTLGVHEGWTEKEIQDTAKALEKVERNYRMAIIYTIT